MRLLLIVILLTGGIMLMISASRILSTNIRLKKWRTAPGVVTSAGIIRTAGGRFGTEDIYIPDIKYTFYIDGTAYKSDKFGLTKTWSSSSKEAEGWLKDICVGKNISILYNPKAPSQSLIYRKDETGRLFFDAVCGSTFIIFAVLVSIPLIRGLAGRNG